MAAATIPGVESASNVNLGTAGNFVILSQSGITNIPTSALTGDVGTSPITGASITGLSCTEVTGTIYTVDAAGPVMPGDRPVLTVSGCRGHCRQRTRMPPGDRWNTLTLELVEKLAG